MNQPQQYNQNQAVQIREEQNFIDSILDQALRSKVITPEDYALENAVKSAYLLIKQEGYVEKCTKESIASAILDMVVQGLNPVKDQCYFIPYGRVLKCSRSYMGSIAVLKRFDPRVEMVHAVPIYEGDQIDYEIKLGVKRNITHKQSLENVKNARIIGVYSTVIGVDGNEIMSDIMMWEELLASWKKSKRNIFDAKGNLQPSSDHAQYPARFARRTIIKRICKMLISATNDKSLMDAYRKFDEELPEQERIQVEIDEKANQKLIDFPRQEQKTIEPIEPEVLDPVEEMASESQIKELYAIEKSNNRADAILENVGSFINRKIAGLSELTRREIEEYIGMLRDEQKNAGGPDWQ